MKASSSLFDSLRDAFIRNVTHFNRRRLLQKREEKNILWLTTIDLTFDAAVNYGPTNGGKERNVSRDPEIEGGF